jgi:hypothetical protein
MIKIINSWKYNDNLIISEIKHSGDGLSKGCRLISKNSTKIWIINSRLIFNHTIDKQKRFDNETETFLSLSFINEDAKIKSFHSILDNEQKNIYQYLIEPVNHGENPKLNDELMIEK